jgi:hypothetical protein
MEARIPINRRINYWNTAGRWIVFLLAASSIAALLVEFYHLCSMRSFILYIFLPAMAALFAFASLDCLKGNGQLAQAVWIGIIGGLLAAIAYDIFRLPFVFSKEWGLQAIVPPMQLFKVFPRFGAMILGQPIEQDHYALPAQLVGWAYHFSNGATFGVMYMAMVGEGTRRHWAWAVLFAMGLELGMLFTPYPQMFGIALTARFVVVTLIAHGIFGVELGLAVRWLTRQLHRVNALPAKR